jgi:hypothetical protein
MPKHTPILDPLVIIRPTAKVTVVSLHVAWILDEAFGPFPRRR